MSPGSYRRHGSEEYYLRSGRSLPSSSFKGLHGKGYGSRDKYPGINKAVDFRKSDKIVAEMAFAARSKRSQSQDLIRMAPVTDNLEVWLHNPNRYDFQGVDTADPKLIFSHKSKRAQAADLAKAAKRVPLEIWIRDTAHADLEGVDTKNAKQGSTVKRERVVRKFKVMPKEEAKKHDELKKAETKKTEEKGHHLPSSEEINARAVEMFQEKQTKAGLPNVTPEKKELSEAGLLQAARQDLMTTSAKVDSQVLEYVHNLNSELEPMGFRVVEID